MKNIFIKATDETPEVDFNFANHTHKIKGESYPENVSIFYTDVCAKLSTYLNGLSGQKVLFEFEMKYINSNTVKVIITILDLLEDAAERGNDMIVNWYYHEEDDTMMEYGEEFSEDLEHLTFHMKTL